MPVRTANSYAIRRRLLALLLGAWPAGALGQTPEPFSEEAMQRGVAYIYTGYMGHQTWGRGVALADLDGDGHLDIVGLGGLGGQIGLYENAGGGVFTDRSADAGAPIWPAATSVTAADYDGDGDLDLYIGQWLEPNLLLRNDGGWAFTDVSSSTGVDDDGPAQGCAWADYDGDGWLDVYVANRTLSKGSVIPNRLYRNLGDGTFEEVAIELGVDDGQSPSFQAVFFDMDRDTDPDLYVSNDKGRIAGEQNRLYENVGGFLDVSDASGTAAGIDAMGVAVGDFDGNGLPDLYITNTQAPPGNLLLLNQDGAVFTAPTAEASGTASMALGWGAAFVDYDNDGWLELYVCNASALPNRLYEHDGVWPAIDLAEPLGLAEAHLSYGLAVGDVDGDGDIDLLVQDSDRLRLYVNHEGTQRHWLRLVVRAPGPNRFAIGAVADLRLGEAWQTREVAIGRGYKSQHELTLHLGCGDATVADELIVTYRDGAVRTLTGYPTDVTWTVHHPDLLLDADGDGDVDLDDARALAGCFGPVAPGCEIVDADGSGLIDEIDLDALLSELPGPLLDCDGNGVADVRELLTGDAVDVNGNSILDACESGGDVDGDGAVTVDDLLVVILNCGACPIQAACYGDADGDSFVNVDDLVTVILNWTPAAP